MKKQGELLRSSKRTSPGGRLLSLALCLTLVLTLLPTAALAADQGKFDSFALALAADPAVDDTLTVGGKEYTYGGDVGEGGLNLSGGSENPYAIKTTLFRAGNGYVRWEPTLNQDNDAFTEGTITLCDADSSGNLVLPSKKLDEPGETPLTLHLEGSSRFARIETADGEGVFPGSLTVTGEADGRLDVGGSDAAYGGVSVFCPLIVESGTLSGESSLSAIAARGITIKGGTVSAKSDRDYALYSFIQRGTDPAFGSVTITGGTVNLESGVGKAIYAEKPVILSGDAEVNTNGAIQVLSEKSAFADVCTIADSVTGTVWQNMLQIIKDWDGTVQTTYTMYGDLYQDVAADGLNLKTPPKRETTYPVGDGYMKYTPGEEEAPATLTLHDVTLSTSPIAITLPQGVSINLVVEGTNSLHSENTLAISGNGTTIFLSGPGSLTVDGWNGIGMSCGELNVAEGTTLNGMAVIVEYDDNNIRRETYTAHGAVTISEYYSWTGENISLAVAAGATLTVDARLNLSSAQQVTVAEGGKIVNNSKIDFGTNGDGTGRDWTLEQIAALNMDGDGAVILNGIAYQKAETGYAVDITDAGLSYQDASAIPTIPTTYLAGGGKAVFTPATATEPAKLTLTDATVFGGLGLSLLNQLTIEVYGDNYIGNATGNGYAINTKSLTLTGPGTLTAVSEPYLGFCRADIEIAPSGTTPGVFQNNLGDRLHAMVEIPGFDFVGGENPPYAVTVYGQVMLNATYKNYSAGDSFTVDATATLTVPTGITLDVSAANSTFVCNGTVVNNGTVILPDSFAAADIGALGFGGSGLVQVNGVSYNNQGVALHVASTAMDFIRSSDEGNWNPDAALDTDGYAWNEKTQTLTLQDLALSVSDADAITLPDGAKLVLRGKNIVTSSISTDEGDFSVSAVAGDGDLTISGDGSLLVSGAVSNSWMLQHGLYVPDALTIAGGTLAGEALICDDLSITGGTVAVNDLNADSSMTIEGGTVDASWLNSYGALNISGGTVTVQNNVWSAISVWDGDVNITGGTVVAASDGCGIRVSDGDVRITGGSVTASGNTAAICTYIYGSSPSMLALLSEDPCGDIITTGMTVVTTPAGGVPVMDEDETIRAFSTAQKLELDEDGDPTNACTKVVLTEAHSGGNGGGGGGGSTTTPGTVHNPDGSTTVTTTDKAAGTVTETTKKPDGSTTVVETKKDGTATTTDKTASGVMTVTQTDKDGVATGTTVSVPSTVQGKVQVSIPTDLGKTGGTVSAVVTYPDGTKETVTGAYSGGKVSLSVSGSATIELLDDFLPLAALPFTDVVSGSYYEDAVRWAVAKGITGGVSDTAFAPNAACTRAQTVTFLWRAMGSPEPTTTVNPFTDVPADAYYYKAVLWAVENGITGGVTATTFAPGATVSRAQEVTFLWRAAGKPTVNFAMAFTDVADGSYYTEAVRWAVSQGITGGTGATAFSPANSCTRAQIVTFLYRYLTK